MDISFLCNKKEKKGAMMKLLVEDEQEHNTVDASLSCQCLYMSFCCMRTDGRGNLQGISIGGACSVSLARSSTSRLWVSHVLCCAMHASSAASSRAARWLSRKTSLQFPSHLQPGPQQVDPHTIRPHPFSPTVYKYRLLALQSSQPLSHSHSPSASVTWEHSFLLFFGCRFQLVDSIVLILLRNFTFVCLFLD